MKRYVKEFANDVIKELEETLKTEQNSGIIEERIERVKKVVKLYERQYITTREAMCEILKCY